MGIYNEEIENLEKKKQSAVLKTGSKTGDRSAALKSELIRDEHAVRSAQKTDEYKSAYRQILEHDFTSQAWIGKSAQKRKHRKNINSNYKTVTGKKRTGLSDNEKNLRKSEFEDRRELSLKASGLVADLLTKLNKNENFGDDENLAFFETIKEMDTGAFEYSGEGMDADRDFLVKFEENMPLLHRAADLYEKLLEEGSFPKLEGEERMTVMSRLAYMKEVRTAYEDRIRIISSPYYVSLREKDFVGNAPENLEKIRNNRKEAAPLRAYAASVLRWRNQGLSLFQNKTLTDLEIGQNLLEEDIRSRRKTDTYASDKAIDGIIGKLGTNVVNAVLNDQHDTVAVGMAIKTAKDWVYSDLKKKVSRDEMKARLKEMQKIVEGKIKDDVNIDLKKYKNTLLHLQNISKKFEAKEISEEVMKLWLDRGLQHDLRMGRQIYDGIVYQKYRSKREQDDPYGKAVNALVNDYFHNLPGGVVTLQGSKTAYFRKEDEGKVTEKKAMYKKLQQYPERLGILPDKSDFIHIIGGQADTNITTRAYISAKSVYKSKAVELFMETVREYKLQDKLYFKIVTKANQGRYGMDDITVFFTGNVTPEEQKKILETFYEKCNKDGENILDGDDMCVTGTRYKNGIALAPEPSVVDTLNTLFFDDSKFNDVKRQKDAHDKDEKVRPNFSFNTFITSMFCQSAITANYMMGKGISAKINVADKKTTGLMKKVFRQLCFLNGVDPRTMS